jgi:hypothetical protein
MAAKDFYRKGEKSLVALMLFRFPRLPYLCSALKYKDLVIYLYIKIHCTGY